MDQVVVAEPVLTEGEGDSGDEGGEPIPGRLEGQEVSTPCRKEEGKRSEV